MLIDSRTVVLVCAGPSIDRLSDAAWGEIGRAAATVSVNGALAAEACLEHGVRFTYAAAMDAATGLADHVPAFAEIWKRTPAWRVSAHGTAAESESFVKEVEWWGDSPDEGYVGGSTAMVVGNWLCNDWPDDPESRAALAEVERRSGKRIPPRGFRRLAYVGLDMVPGRGGHAKGAGRHASGFSRNPEAHRRVCAGWAYFAREARARGIEVVNLTPGTGLLDLARLDAPDEWLIAGERRQAES